MGMRRIAVVMTSVCLLLLAGCTTGRLPGASAPEPALSGLGWPPAGPPLRTASDYQTVLTGAETTMTHGNTSLDGSALAMDGGLTWALYSVGNITAANALVAVAAASSVTPATPGDDTALYFALANYARGAWEWIPGPTAADPWVCPAGDAASYQSGLQQVYLAVVLGGPGTARVETVSFTHALEPVFVTAPQNLTATAAVPQQIDLDWDDIPGAFGYNIYRTLAADLSGMTKLNTLPVVTSEYMDAIATQGDYFFYQVTAVGLNESDPSDSARVWCFAADLSAPVDFKVVYFGTQFVTLNWGWDAPGGDPGGFNMYIDTVPDFTMYSPTLEVRELAGDDRAETFSPLLPNVTYYLKIFAVETPAGPRGRITDEVPATVSRAWTWSSEEIGVGQPPVRAVAGAGVIAVSYFNDAGVNFAIQDGEGWRVEEPLQSEPESFSEFQDLCYGGGTYLVSAYADAPGDCWIAEWADTDIAGNWATHRIDGDGEVGFDKPRSGMNISATASNTEFCVLEYFLTNTEMVAHTRDITGGSWTRTVIRSDYSPSGTPAHSAGYLDENLYVISAESVSDPLLFGDRDGGWVWQDVRGAGVPKLAKHNDLQRFNGEWFTPGFYASGKDLYLLHGETPPWTSAQLVGMSGQQAGYDARMAVEGDEAVIIEKQGTAYWFAMASDGWIFQQVTVPLLTTFGSDPDVVMLDGCIYFAYQNSTSGEIMIAKATPPA